MTTGLQKSAQEELKRLVAQIEKLSEEQKDLGTDISDKYKEAKSLGFDPKILRKIIRMRKQTPSEREEEQSLLEVYAHALGMEGTPMGDYLAEQDQREVAHA